jgi:hypothetical protein
VIQQISRAVFDGTHAVRLNDVSIVYHVHSCAPPPTADTNSITPVLEGQ